MTGTLHWRGGKDPSDDRPYGEMIEFGTRRAGGAGYMSYSSRVGPGVLLLHEFFGLTRSFCDYADALNDSGFTVLVPDLYDGRVATSVDEATRMAEALEPERVLARLHAAAEHLTSNWHPRLGVVGFSLGAGYSVRLAQELSLDATVLYYGMAEVDPARWSGPVLGHFAETDEWESPAAVEPVFDHLSRVGVDAELIVHPGTGHWFANPAVPGSYDPPAAEAAWEATVDFLTYHLA